MPGRGRPRGSRNKPDHGAGGRREGAGRKRRSEGEEDPRQSTKRPFRPEEEPEASSDDRRALPPSDEQYLDPQDHWLQGSDPHTQQQDIDVSSGLGHGDTGPFDDDVPASVQAILANYLTNPVNPLPAPAAAASPAMAAQLSAFGSPTQVSRAIMLGLAQSDRPTDLPAWARGKPSHLQGPFLCMSTVDNSTPNNAETASATVYGPVDPKLLDSSTVIAVYYACYPISGGRSSPSPRQPSHIDLTSLDPALTDPSRQHSQSLGTTGQPKPFSAPSLPPRMRIDGNDGSYPHLDPYKVPDVDMEARKRAPRKCGVCGQYYCRGRGNRALCPHVEGNPPDQSQTPQGQANLAAPTPLSAQPPPLPEHQGLGPPPFSASDIPVNHSFKDPIAQYQAQRGLDASTLSQSSHRLAHMTALSPSVRKRGPRRCFVCKGYNCPGNGSRKLCKNAQIGDAYVDPDLTMASVDETAHSS